MATYFHGNSEIQAADGLQTLVLMNPGFIQYSDTPPPHASNLVFLNSAHTNTSLNPQSLSHAAPAHMQQFVGIPLQTATSQDGHHPSTHPQLDIAALHGFAPRVHPNLWNTIDPNTEARETPRAQQGLSLSLSSQQAGYGSFRVDRDVASQAQGPVMSGDDARVSGGSSSSASGVTNGISGMQSSVPLSSKYLKAAQDLLDEVVNVNGGNFGSKTHEFGKKNTSVQNKVNGQSSTAASGDGSTGGEASVKPGSELSTAERQEVQMKKAKLINMLDEVEQRYRQYHHQMLIVISSFEQAAGIGSARTYTALALQTISKQFRCLKDAITGQIKAANRSLGEEDCLGGRIEGSRLKFVDNHFRQQRALQQLGMIQHTAWRPQRGLPERSVSVLRAWLFEHFLHPYPKDSDKHMLAKQTGLTRSQVSNWFINARVRLWKPMVEEMYVEEMKELEQNVSESKTSKSSEDTTPKYSAPKDKIGATDNQPRSSNSKHDNSINQNSPTTGSVSKASTLTSPVAGNARNQSGFSLVGSSELDGITQGSPKKPRNRQMLHSPTNVASINMDIKCNDADEGSISIKFGDERQSRDGYTFTGSQNNFIGGFGQYPIGEIGRFDAEHFTPSFSGNGVSLTLGLPHCENLSLSGAHQTFLSNQNMQLGRRVDISEQNEFGAMSTSAPHSSSTYENMNLQNPKRFAAQLLPDFVA